MAEGYGARGDGLSPKVGAGCSQPAGQGPAGDRFSKPGTLGQSALPRQPRHFPLDSPARSRMLGT